MVNKDGTLLVTNALKGDKRSLVLHPNYTPKWSDTLKYTTSIIYLFFFLFAALVLFWTSCLRNTCMKKQSLQYITWIKTWFFYVKYIPRVFRIFRFMLRSSWKEPRKEKLIATEWILESGFHWISLSRSIKKKIIGLARKRL